MNIVGENITLRAIEMADLPLLQSWSNNPEIQYWLGGWHTPSSAIVMENWFKRITADNDNIRFAIEHADFGLIGTANLVNINWKDKNAVHGMLLGDPNLRGKGIGFEVVNLVMQFAFEELGLNRLDTTIIEYNESSKKLYIEKCGWKLEGVAREWYFRKDKFWDKLLIGITKKDYFEKRNIR